MKILQLSAISPAAVTALRRDHELVDGVGVAQADVATLTPGCEVVILRSGTGLDRQAVEAADALRLVIRAGSGTDNIDLDALASRGIALERVPEPGAAAVAEMAITLMLALGRNVVTADRLLRDGRWAKSELTGSRLAGKTLGIVGAGNIGQRVGQLGTILGMHVIGCVEHTDHAAHERLATHGIELRTLGDVLAAADVLSLHVPLTPRTRHMLDRAALAAMRPGALLVNLARGGVVDEHALRDALASGHLAGAAVDVHEHEGARFASPLVDLPNVILTPHIGAGTREAQDEIGRRIVDIVHHHATAGAVPLAPAAQS